MNTPFIITIDTEGDNLWEIADVNQEITTVNAKFLFRFQELCEKYGFIPTYLTNYEMAKSDAMIELGREGLKRKTLEIGAHEHAWNQPPHYALLKRPGKRGKPYLRDPDSERIRTGCFSMAESETADPVLSGSAGLPDQTEEGSVWHPIW